MSLPRAKWIRAADVHVRSEPTPEASLWAAVLMQAVAVWAITHPSQQPDVRGSLRKHYEVDAWLFGPTTTTMELVRASLSDGANRAAISKICDGFLSKLVYVRGILNRAIAVRMSIEQNFSIACILNRSERGCIECGTGKAGHAGICRKCNQRINKRFRYNTKKHINRTTKKTRDAKYRAKRKEKLSLNPEMAKLAREQSRKQKSAWRARKKAQVANAQAV